MKLYNAHNKTGVRELWLGKPQLSGSVSLNLTAVSSAERLLPVVFSDRLCRFIFLHFHALFSDPEVRGVRTATSQQL